jgi:hypothetical protein
MVSRNGADNRIEANVLETQVALPTAAQGRHHLLEWQHRRDVVRLEAKARDDPRQCDAPALTCEIGLGVLLG